MRALIYPSEPAAHRVSVIRRNGDAAAVCLCPPSDDLGISTVASESTRTIGVEADKIIDATVATIRHVGLSNHHRPEVGIFESAEPNALGIVATMIVAWFPRRRESRADAGGAALAGRAP